MKNYLLLLFSILFSAGLFSQTTLLSEDFEGATNQFTSSAAVSTTANWTINSTLSNGGTNSIAGTVNQSDTLWLESTSFSTMGFVAVNLSFSHICKVDFFDKAFVQYSIDNGSTWITANSANYSGSANFIGNSFSAVSYIDWQPGSATAQPTNAWWKSEQFNLAATANNMQVKVRFALIDGDNNGSLGNFGWLIDDVSIIGATCELVAPTLSNPIDLSGFQYTTSPLAIGIDAFDASGIAAAKAFFTVNSGLLDSVSLTLTMGTSYAGSLPGFLIGDTVCYYYQVIDNTTCSNVAISPQGSCYQFIVRNSPPTTCLGIPNGVFPYNEDFSSFSASNPFNLINNWENSTADDFDWEIQSGPTNSNLTGPNGDHTTGAGNYIYMETSGPSTNDEAHLITPCYDLTGLGNAEFSFWYHMFGATMGELHVDLFANNSWNLDVIQPFVGNQGNTWLRALVDLRPYVGQVVKLRFRGIRGTNFTSDIALDDIELIDVSGIDSRIDSISVTLPTNASCQVSLPQPVEVFIKNLGSTVLTTVPIAYQLNNGSIVRDTFSGNIAPGGRQSFIFNQLVNLNGSAFNYTVKSWTDLSNDIRVANDSTQINFQLTPTISTYPFNENFDSFTTGNPGVLLNGWSNDPAADLTWNVNTGPTGSAATGPSQDQNSTGSGNYLYLESSSSFLNANALLLSNCIDLTSVTSPQLSFWYHMFGATMGELHVDVIQNGVLNLDVTPAIIGNQGNVWVNRTINLSAYVGQVIQLRFRGIRGSSFTSDIAIDNIEVTAGASPDLGVSALISPVFTGCQPSATQPLQVTIQNFSGVASSFVPLAYRLNNGAVVRDTLQAVIPPFGNVNFTFSGVLTVQNGSNSLVVWSAFPGDPNPLNDTLNQVLQLSAVQTTFPTSEPFSSFTTGNPGMFMNGWENEVTTDSHDWYVNSGSTPTAGTGPTGDHTTGTGNYLYVNANGFSGTTARVVSGCYDLTNANAPELDFWYHMSGADMGTLHVDLDVNGFYVQDIIAPISGDQGANWVNQQISLSGYPSIIRLIFRADIITKTGTIAGDIAIDDININVTPVGLEELQEGLVVGEIYPNPTSGAQAKLLVTSDKESVLNTSLIDVNGRIINQNTIGIVKGRNTISISTIELDRGVYFYRLIESGRSITKKLIVQ